MVLSLTATPRVQFAGDPDELRTTVDRQTVRIKISRPPAADVVR